MRKFVSCANENPLWLYVGVGFIALILLFISRACYGSPPQRRVQTS